MAPTPDSGVPAILIAGETWNWTDQFPDLPISDGWTTLKYEFRGVDTLDLQNAPQITNDGSTWTVITLPADTTAKLAGRYEWFARLTGSGTYAGQQRIAKRGTVTIKANPSTAVAGAYQTNAEQMLALVQAELKARITGTGSAHDSRMIDGFQLNKIDVGQLQDLEKTYLARVYQERHQGKLGPDVAFRI
jgi:hypothetical protein